MLKRLLAIVSFALVAGCSTVPSAGGAADPDAVASAAERLRVAMVDPTREALAALVDDNLSYGHSGGRVDTKQSYIDDLLAGRSDFVSIAITEQTIKVVGDVAIVRHALSAQTNDSGKPGAVSLKVLGIWQKQGGVWRLIARQAVRT
jgi:hypothetical protein